jgi:hypothetical protein
VGSQPVAGSAELPQGGPARQPPGVRPRTGDRTPPPSHQRQYQRQIRTMDPDLVGLRISPAVSGPGQNGGTSAGFSEQCAEASATAQCQPDVNITPA